MGLGEDPKISSALINLSLLGFQSLCKTLLLNNAIFKHFRSYENKKNLMRETTHLKRVLKKASMSTVLNLFIYMLMVNTYVFFIINFKSGTNATKHFLY